MAKFLKRMAIAVTFGLSGISLVARVNFGSLDSAIKVSQQATLKISSSNLTIDGTLAKEGSASVTGQQFSFSNGILELSGKPITMSASYIPSQSASSTQVSLNGGNYLRVEPGALISSITVDGTSNKLEGAPLFQKPIVLVGQTSELTLSLQNKLNKNINLNKGTLLLENDLSLLDNVFINGPGTVKLKGRDLFLGGYYTPAWKTEIDFDGATSIHLNGNIALKGKWQFFNVNKINGNGATLTLQQDINTAESQNRFVVKNAASLSLTDVYLKNVNNGMIRLLGKQNNNAAGILNLSNVVMELQDDVSFDAGSVVIAGPTTIILNGHKLSFSGSSVLQILDRLSVDTLGATAGDIFVGGSSLSSQSSGSSGNNYTIGENAVFSDCGISVVFPYNSEVDA